MQLMIYVGGTLVLLVFGVMLTAKKSFISMQTRGGEWVIACFVGGTLLLLLVTAAFSVADWNRPGQTRGQLARADVEDTTRIGLAFSGVHPGKLDAGDERLRAGLSGYLLPFEIVSVHLVVVLIGAGYLARAKRRT
jgi:NADH:ubiquinone oxidoreductase subunit 6 (subunit J)